MDIFSKILNRKVPNDERSLKVDMHSHLIYDVDDGVKTIDEAIEMILALKEMGYEKVITTPHIMTDFYKNSKQILMPKFEEIKNKLEQLNISFSIECAAEYYIDDGFLSLLKDRENLMTIENKYLLIETSYINEPVNFNEVIFEIQSGGLKPIIAHPERYTYMYSSFDKYEILYDRGVNFQLNINSLAGYYSKGAKDFAHRLIKKDMVDFLGTDCHGPRHISALKKSMKTKDFRNALALNIKNNSLL